MKSFEQRKKEILRRSERRIAKRKKRTRRILGITGCFAVAAMCVVTFAPRNGNYDTVNNMAADAAYDTAYDSGVVGNEQAVSTNGDMAPESYAGNPGAGTVPQEYAAEAVPGTNKKSEAVQLQVTEFDLQENRLTAQLSNSSNMTASYGPGFDIEYQTEDGWVSCAETDMGWDAVLYLLNPGETVTEEYLLGGFDLSQPGTYRLVKYCNLNEEEDSTPYLVVAEFTIEETP